ncbi:hypothetical protein HK405_000300, partial [Cladochytrium tenue]
MASTAFDDDAPASPISSIATAYCLPDPVDDSDASAAVADAADADGTTPQCLLESMASFLDPSKDVGTARELAACDRSLDALRARRLADAHDTLK